MINKSNITPELLDQLLANYEKPEDLTGDDGLFKQLKKALIERGTAISTSSSSVQDRLRAGAVAAVTAAAAGRVPLLVAKMIAQLRTKRPLNQRLLQLLEKSVRTCEVFRLLIVSKQLNPVVQV